MSNSARPTTSDPGIPGTLPRTLVLAAALAAPAAAQFSTYSDRLAIGWDDAEITPDGRYAVARTTNAATLTSIIDLATGTEVYSQVSGMGNLGIGPANDAVAVTDTRAVTLGSTTQIIDLTTPVPTLLNEIDCGFRSRDVEISDGGAFAVVRGGSSQSGPTGGTYVIDLATATTVFFHPSVVQSVFNGQLGNDMVAATADHGVSLALDPNTGDTIVLVVELDPPAGGGPRIVLETLGPDLLAGRPMDVVTSPDGQYATVRSEDEVVLFRLDGTNTAIARRFSSFPGPTIPYLETSFDVVEMTNDVWATITLGDPNSSAGYLDVEDTAGTHWFSLIEGSPRDLTITPDGETLLVHTGLRIYQFDLANLPMGGGALSNVNSRLFQASHSGIRAGLDSVVATNELAAVIAPDGQTTRLRVYDIASGPRPVRIYRDEIPGWPIDVEITRDGSTILVSSDSHAMVVDTRTRTTRLNIDSQRDGFFPWCDGAAIHPDHAVAFGIGGVNANFGWLDTVDLVSRERLVCRSLPNSTGDVGDLFALGSTRVSENDLELHARFLPPGAAGLFLLSDATQTMPLGGGILCLSGNVIRRGVQFVTADGAAVEVVDITQLPVVGGGVVPGSTWYAQFVHRDAPAAGSFNYTNASSLLFQ